MKINWTWKDGSVFRSLICCDAYVDQGKYIGDDPVGYKCYQAAVHRVGDKDLCDWCYRHQSRITFKPGKREQ